MTTGDQALHGDGMARSAMAGAAFTRAGLTTLAGRLTGSLLLPSYPGYAAVGKLTIGRFDQPEERLPAVVVRCVTAGDAVEAIAFARAEGLPIAVRSGGHSFAEYSSTDGLLLDLGRLDAVRLGAGEPFARSYAALGGRAVTVGAGVRIGTLAARLAARRLVVPCGWCPTVGVAGAVLGGGYGALGRYYGLACDHLIAAQVVLADGRIVVADAYREPDLFWALRGAGGGNFGVVTALLMRTRPAVPTTTFHCRWPYRHAAELIEAWQRWAPDAAGWANAELALLAPGDPAQEPWVVLFGLAAGEQAATIKLLGGFAALAGVDLAGTAVRTVAWPRHDPAGQHTCLGHPASDRPATGRAAGEPPGLRVSRSQFYDLPLPAAAVRRLIEQFAADRVPGQFRDLEFVPWRGAYRDVPAEDTAFVHRNARFMLKHAVELDGRASHGQRQAARDWLTGSTVTVRGCGNGGVYPNHPDPELAGWATAYYGGNLPRLRRIKAGYDPDDMFNFEQSVPGLQG